jgi:hypothetical protein
MAISVKAIDVPTQITAVSAQLPQLKFPIANAQSLLTQLGSRTFTFLGKSVTAAVGVSHIPSTLFPIQSLADLESKMSSTIATRAQLRGITVTGIKLPITPVKTITPTLT